MPSLVRRSDDETFGDTSDQVHDRGKVCISWHHTTRPPVEPIEESGVMVAPSDVSCNRGGHIRRHRPQ